MIAALSRFLRLCWANEQARRALAALASVFIRAHRAAALAFAGWIVVKATSGEAMDPATVERGDSPPIVLDQEAPDPRDVPQGGG